MEETKPDLIHEAKYLGYFRKKFKNREDTTVRAKLNTHESEILEEFFIEFARYYYIENNQKIDHVPVWKKFINQQLFLPL